MRFIVAALVIVIALVMLGWMSFSTTDDSAAVTIETNKVVEDTERFVDEASEAIDTAIEKVSEDVEDADEITVQPGSRSAVESE